MLGTARLVCQRRPTNERYTCYRRLLEEVHRDNGKENGSYCLGFRVKGLEWIYGGYIGIMEKKMEAKGPCRYMVNT